MQWCSQQQQNGRLILCILKIGHFIRNFSLCCAPVMFSWEVHLLEMGILLWHKSWNDSHITPGTPLVGCFHCLDSQIAKFFRYLLTMFQEVTPSRAVLFIDLWICNLDSSVSELPQLQNVLCLTTFPLPPQAAATMGCMTSDSGPDLEPILTADGSRRREIFEVSLC